MELRTKKTIRAVSLSVLLAGLLAACGASDEPKRSTAGAPLGAATAAGMDVCANCHLGMVQEWLQTPHANLNASQPSDLSYAGNPAFADADWLAAPATCIPCHDQSTDSANLQVGLSGDTPRPIVGCEDCHGPGSNHDGALALNSRLDPDPAFGTANPVSISGWVNTCMECHELISPADGAVAATATHRSGGLIAPNNDDNNITDTHFATAGDYTGGANINPITGYAMDFSSETACTECHYPHGPITVHREWARSAHADKTAAGAWAHYKWSDANRRVCQRCHTTTGYAAYASALEAGNTALARSIFDGSNPPLAVVANFKPEMLKCNACHKDNKGTLRNPGAITANYDYASGGTTYATVSHTFPDLSYSNICMACHTGRENGESIANLSASFNLANGSFINSHYLTGGATMFTVSGYEYPGRSYANLSTYLHDKIGSSAIPRTGTRGPCIGCHMSRPAGNGDHLFMPVVRNTITPTTIDSITSEVCIVCHITSNTVIKDIVQEQKNQYRAALEALEAQLVVRGYHFYEAHPYFYTATYNPGYTEAGSCSQNLPIKNWQTGGTSTFLWSGTACVSSTGAAGTTGTGKHNMGAAFNYNMLHHDAGAYVHNRYYVKRLIYDAIDWLDNNQMDYSVGATLNALPGATSYKLEAMTYLLPNGVLGYNAERP